MENQPYKIITREEESSSSSSTLSRNLRKIPSLISLMCSGKHVERGRSRVSERERMKWNPVCSTIESINFGAEVFCSFAPWAIISVTHTEAERDRLVCVQKFSDWRCLNVERASYFLSSSFVLPEPPPDSGLQWKLLPRRTQAISSVEERRGENRHDNATGRKSGENVSIFLLFSCFFVFASRWEMPWMSSNLVLRREEWQKRCGATVEPQHHFSSFEGWRRVARADKNFISHVMWQFCSVFTRERFSSSQILDDFV